MDITVQLSANLPVKLTKRKKWVVASCPILDVHSQGENEKKAKKNLKEALTLFFISCFERGTLDAALKSCGFNPVDLADARKKPLQPAKDFIRVPIPFLGYQHAHQDSCHV